MPQTFNPITDELIDDEDVTPEMRKAMAQIDQTVEPYPLVGEQPEEPA